MDKNKYFEKVQKIIVNELNIDIGRLVEGAEFVFDLGFDSLDILDLITCVEKEFGILIAEEEIKELTTVKKLSEFVQQKLA